MKTYAVLIPIIGEFYLEVAADSPADAILAARDACSMTNLQWEAQEDRVTVMEVST